MVWMDGWIDESIEEWTDGWIDKYRWTDGKKSSDFANSCPNTPYKL
jgi:hypothetical protein